jgi:hypothetical protein
MSEPSPPASHTATGAEHIDEAPEVIDPPGAEADGDDTEPSESIDQPAKVMRVGAMMRQLLEELRNADLDEKGRDRMREIYEISVRELGSAMSPDLREELGRLALPFSDEEVPSEAELRVAEAQLVGWLEGLIQGIQASLFAQQMAAQQQLASVRAGLPAGQRPQPQQMPGGGPAPVADADGRPGTYL